MIKKLNDAVLEMEILPIKEIEQVNKEMISIPKPNPKEQDVFKNDIVKKMDESIISTPTEEQENIDSDDISSIIDKKTIGERGKDKKPRKKWIMTEKRKVSLAKAREASLLKRTALKIEKNKLKAEVTKKATENLNKTVSFEELKPDRQGQQINPNKKDQEHFFNLMDEWHTRKQTRKQIKKKESISHPASAQIPIQQRPTPPQNPFDELFNYQKKNNNLW
jgi:hypothetical protein